MSYPLPLSPLPCLRAYPCPVHEIPPLEGFVDDEAVFRLLSSQPPRVRLQPARAQVVREDLVLSSGDDDDYAGWHGGICPRLAARPAFAVPLTAVFRPHHVPLEFSPRRAAPPVSDEPGLEPSYQSGHRWWLAATAGALCALLFATVLLSLARRTSLPDAADSFYPAPPNTTPVRFETTLPAMPPAPQEITSHSVP